MQSLVQTKDKSNLRYGYTTGACVAAASVAAWHILQNGIPVPSVRILFLDGKIREIPIQNNELIEGMIGCATVIKDAGDDPDVTDGSTIKVMLSKAHSTIPLSYDFVEQCNSGFITIRGSGGIGIVTKDGLAVQKGKWAINPSPRKMIVENLKNCGLGIDGSKYLLEICIENGEELAAKTLNPVLGIVGGLSVLGTTGIVTPSSHKAYVHTIVLLLKGAKLANCRKVVFTTGEQTLRAAKKVYPELPEIAFIKVADFIGASLRAASACGISKVALSFMPAKLVKVAMGFKCTNVRVNQLSKETLARIILRRTGDSELAEKCVQANTIREIFFSLSSAKQLMFVNELAEQATFVIKQWMNNISLEILVSDYDGNLIKRFSI